MERGLEKDDGGSYRNVDETYETTGRRMRGPVTWTVSRISTLCSGLYRRKLLVLVVAIVLLLGLWSMYTNDHDIQRRENPAGNYAKPIAKENKQEFPISKDAATTYLVENGLNFSAPARFITQPMDSSDILEMNQFDPRLWEHVKSNHIIPPSTLPYPFAKESKGGLLDPPVDKFPFEMFKNKIGGVFVEAGALDGVYSHTLMYEVTRNWTGLLIECNPLVLPTLKSVHRKAYVADVCLSTEDHPGKSQLTTKGDHLGSTAMGTGRKFFLRSNSSYTVYDVQTVPLYAILAAVGIREVDLFVLDIQALELAVLKLFPFHLVLVRVWMVEVALIHETEKLALRRLMEKNGYSKDRFWDCGSDYIFVHESFNP